MKSFLILMARSREGFAETIPCSMAYSRSILMSLALLTLCSTQNPSSLSASSVGIFAETTVMFLEDILSRYTRVYLSYIKFTSVY